MKRILKHGHELLKKLGLHKLGVCCASKKACKAAPKKACKKSKKSKK